MFMTILQQFTKNGVVSKWIPCRTSLVRLSILTNHENVLLVFPYAFLNHEGLIWCDLFHCGVDIWAVTTFSCHDFAQYSFQLIQTLGILVLLEVFGGCQVIPPFFLVQVVLQVDGALVLR